MVYAYTFIAAIMPAAYCWGTADPTLLLLPALALPFVSYALYREFFKYSVSKSIVLTMTLTIVGVVLVYGVIFYKLMISNQPPG